MTEFLRRASFPRVLAGLSLLAAIVLVWIAMSAPSVGEHSDQVSVTPNAEVR